MKYTVRYKAGTSGPFSEEFRTTEELIERLNKLLVANYTIINIRMGEDK